MTADDQHGFDIGATRTRLEDWCLNHFACPVDRGSGRSAATLVLLIGHWGEHGVHHGDNGKLASVNRCFESPCAVLGVALAVLEICAYGAGVAELDEIEWLKQVERRLFLPERTRAEFLARAGELAASPVSRAVANATAGRPKRILAQAVAQQLWTGGFSQSQIAVFMGATVEATRRRCKVSGVRSLAAVLCPRTNGCVSRGRLLIPHQEQGAVRAHEARSSTVPRGPSETER